MERLERAVAIVDTADLMVTTSKSIVNMGKRQALPVKI
jgi:hypothetical protein